MALDGSHAAGARRGRMRLIRPAWVAGLLVLAGCGDGSPEAGAAQEAREPQRACEWCGADEAPDSLSWRSRIAPPDQSGEPLTITGTVYHADGTTPYPGVIVYAYHTDAGGVYPDRDRTPGNGRRHGSLRGWVRTGEDGRYRFDTIRPGSYPNGAEPAHVHLTILPPGGDELWIESIHFADDPLLDRVRHRLTGRGGSGIVEAERGEGGGWRATRDIVVDP